MSARMSVSVCVCVCVHECVSIPHPYYEEKSFLFCVYTIQSQKRNGQNKQSCYTQKIQLSTWKAKDKQQNKHTNFCKDSCQFGIRDNLWRRDFPPRNGLRVDFLLFRNTSKGIPNRTKGFDELIRTAKLFFSFFDKIGTMSL